MEWYYILLIVIASLVLLVLLISYICFYKTFYSKNKQTPNGEVDIPDDDIFRDYKDVILADIYEVKTYPCKDIFITSFDGLKLHGRYYEKYVGAPLEIMFHGYRGNSTRDMSTGVKRAFRCGRNALIVDQRASGLSEGHVISFGINERRDCLSWVNYVVDNFSKDQKIILSGVSMGAATVMNASSMDLPSNVIGVLADCGYNKPEDIIKKCVKDMKLPPNLCYPFIKLGAKIYGKFNLDEACPIESISKCKLPVIFIHGDKDDFVPHYMSVKLYEACKSRKQFVSIKNAAHGISYLADPTTYVDELNKFFVN